MTKHSPEARNETFLQALDDVIARYAMLSHPFYQYWNEGRLSRQALAEYSKQYYAHVQAFPTYVSAVHSNCDDLSVRQMLLENLIEEERGPENHPELWLRLAEGLGVSRADVKSAELLEATVETVKTLKRITRSENYLDGVAALYAYESQIPEVARTKREGLKTFYGIDDERAVSFFLVHEETDRDHRQLERSILARHSTTQEVQDSVLKAAEVSAKALWRFLDGVYDAYVSEG